MFSGRLDQSATQSASFIRMSMSRSFSKTSSSDWTHKHKAYTESATVVSAMTFSNEKQEKPEKTYTNAVFPEGERWGEKRKKEEWGKKWNAHWAWQSSPRKLTAGRGRTHTQRRHAQVDIFGARGCGCRGNKPDGGLLTWLSLLPSTSKMICPSSWGLWGRGGLWAETEVSVSAKSQTSHQLMSGNERSEVLQLCAFSSMQQQQLE